MSEQQLVVSMTFPGSASLGAFQAGAASAVAAAYHELRERDIHPCIVALGGSSAGSIVATLLAHGILTGRDVPGLLRAAWVDDIDIGVLRGGDDTAPLGLDHLGDELRSLLDDHERDLHPIPTDDVVLHVGLTALRGFDIDIDDEPDLAGLSYADWLPYRLEPGQSDDSLFEADDRPPLVDAVRASASHPMAFAPRLLDRRADRETYTERGIADLPDDLDLWFTDGGLVERRPVGRLLDVAAEAMPDPDLDRVHIVVDPRSSAPTDSNRWADPDTDATWLDGLRRAVSIVPTQALHDDLRLAAQANRRLAELDDLVERLGLDDDGRTALLEWAGLEGVQRVGLEMITPRWARSDRGVDELLSGDFAGAFGGFLEQQIREADFSLGWRSTREWIPEALERRGFGRDIIDAVTDAVDDAWQWERREIEGDGIDQLGVRGRVALAGLAARFARITIGLALPSWPSPADLLDRLPSRS